MDEYADGAQPRDDGANGAHNATCKDPLTDEAAVISEFELILLFSVVLSCI